MAIKNSKPDENTALLLAAASKVSLISELNPANRLALCKSAVMMNVQRGETVKPEGANRWLMFLTEGSVGLYSGKDEVGTLTSKVKKSLQPLFQDKTEYQSIKTTSVCKIIKFGREQFDVLLKEQQKDAIKVIDVQVGPHENLIFDNILADIKANKLALPIDGETATRILSSFKNVKSIPQLADVIQSDAGLSTQIVRLAGKADAKNSDPVISIRGAITRIGVGPMQTNIVALLAANKFKPANAAIQHHMRRYVQRTSLSTGIVQVLAKNIPELKPETASLIALTADIGELAVIGYANKHEAAFKNEKKLGEAIENLRMVLGGWILGNWNFADEFVDAAHVARDWYRNHTGEINYTDLVTASLLIIQATMPDKEKTSVPSANNLLLARRFQAAGIDLKSPANIVKQASANIVAAQSVLKAG